MVELQKFTGSSLIIIIVMQNAVNRDSNFFMPDCEQ
jgi:hypothetical protein